MPAPLPSAPHPARRDDQGVYHLYTGEPPKRKLPPPPHPLTMLPQIIATVLAIMAFGLYAAVLVTMMTPAATP